MVCFHQGDGTRIYRVGLRSGLHMGVAGIWEHRKTGEGRALVTCSVITCEPNSLVREIHNRIPAILRLEDYVRWLDPDVQDPEALMSMLAPYPDEEMAMEFVRMKREPKAKADVEQNGLFADTVPKR
jgi:putative SOS response-associated peptidase YedK